MISHIIGHSRLSQPPAPLRSGSAGEVWGALQVPASQSLPRFWQPASIQASPQEYKLGCEGVAVNNRRHPLPLYPRDAPSGTEGAWPAVSTREDLKNKQMKVSLSLFMLLLHWAWLGDLTQVCSSRRRLVRELPSPLSPGRCVHTYSDMAGVLWLGWLG